MMVRDANVTPRGLPPNDVHLPPRCRSVGCGHPRSAQAVGRRPTGGRPPRAAGKRWTAARRCACVTAGAGGGRCLAHGVTGGAGGSVNRRRRRRHARLQMAATPCARRLTPAADGGSMWAATAASETGAAVAMSRAHVRIPPGPCRLVGVTRSR